MDYGMDQAAAAEDKETCSDEKYPAAFNLVAANTKTTGSECPDSNQQTYKSNDNFLADMVIQQELL
jgi:hypothetical protein